MSHPSSQQLENCIILVALVAVFGFASAAEVWASETIRPRPYYRKVLLSGFTRAKQTVKVSSEVKGKCLAIHAEIGNAVPDSGILAEIDDTFIKLDIQANRLELETVRRQLQTEKKMLRRYTTLLNRNSATEAKLDEVTLSVDLHEMQLKALNNEYQRLQENQARHIITAPKGWTLINRMIEPGEYVQLGQVVAVIGDFSQLIINLAVGYNELNILRKNENIVISFPDLDLKTTAKIYRLSPAFNEATKKVPVDLIIDKNDQQNGLRGGLRGELHLQQQKEATFLLPLSAVISRYDAYWVVKENNERLRVLLLGTTDEGASAIISSRELTLNDRIYAVIPEDF